MYIIYLLYCKCIIDESSKDTYESHKDWKVVHFHTEEDGVWHPQELGSAQPVNPYMSVPLHPLEHSIVFLSSILGQSM